MSLIRVEDLTKVFPTRVGLLRKGLIRAVDGVSLEIDSGETFGLVGESGSGKTTLGRCILCLLTPTSGRVWFDGVDLTGLDGRDLRRMRLRMQIVFQNPLASLNPRMNVRSIVSEPVRVHWGLDPSEADRRVRKLLGMVGLHEEVLGQYPHELSGGQCQRVAIARALAVEPKFLVLDEPTSSLDVSVQAQIVNLLKQLQRDLGLTYLFITHDLSLISYLADRVAVMYMGKVVEIGGVLDVLERGVHPYTRALRSAVPVPDPTVGRRRIPIRGEIPSAMNPPSGCRFRTRCPWAQDRCAAEEPVLRGVQVTQVACHFAESIAEEVVA